MTLTAHSNNESENYCQVANLKPDNLIIYHASRNGNGEKHIGIYKGNGRVESKFGYGHVYNHPFNCVPDDYVCYISFFTQLKDESLGNQATIDNMEKWVKLYGAICSLRIDFQNEFPKGRMKKITEILDHDSNFSFKSESFYYNAETGYSNTTKLYAIKNNFLIDVERCRALKDLYDGKSESWVMQEIKNFAPFSSLYEPVFFSHSLDDAMAIMALKEGLK